MFHTHKISERRMDQMRRDLWALKRQQEAAYTETQLTKVSRGVAQWCDGMLAS